MVINLQEYLRTMPGKTLPLKQKRFIKATLITFGIIAALGVGLHIWFVNNARRMIRNVVFTESKGKLKLELSQVSYNFFTNDLTVKEASLVSTDSTTADVSYRINFDRLSMRVGSFWPLLTNRQVTIDSIHILQPDIVITQWRKDTTKKQNFEEISIPRQMGEIYYSMLDALEAFSIQRIAIVDASVKLINKIKPGSEPVYISNIDFNLVRKPGVDGKRDEFIPEEQTVDLTTSFQNISLPGGRHNLAFRHFQLNLFNKRIEFDSCTVTARGGDSLTSNYKIFFDKLILGGVDFGAMYSYNLIKADSVYCENPQFDININTSVASSNTKAKRPDPEKIIQELTGDLDLAYVGVKSAGIHINITGKNNRSLFNSNKDDFEMRGLRIYADSSQPVTVDRFDMLVRDYHLYNEDSSAAYTFDSIHFENNKITLNNFAVTTTSSPDKRRSERDFRIPYFELTGLDWYQLIFEESLVAREAVLYDPVIRYVKRTPVNKRNNKNSIFRSLRVLDDVITLERISLVNGQIDMQLSPTTSLKIRNANLTMNSNLEEITGLREAVDRLSFSNAVINVKDISAVIINAAYSGKELIHADKISINSRSKATTALVNNVYINNLLIDENSETMLIDGLKWSSAQVSLNPGASAGGSKGPSKINLSNISGNNTRLSFVNGETNITTEVKSLRLASLVKDLSNEIMVDGLEMKGSALQFRKSNTSIHAAAYDISSERTSTIEGLSFRSINILDSTLATIPQVQFSADINSLFNGRLDVDGLLLTKPGLLVHKHSSDTARRPSTASMPIRIGSMRAIEPDIKIAIHKNDSSTVINLPRSENGLLEAGGFQYNEDGLRLDQLSLRSQSATFKKPNGDVIGVEDGKVEAELSQLLLRSGDNRGWAAVVDRLYLKNPNSFALGKNNTLSLSEASFGNLSLSSASVTDVSRLLKDNIAAWMRTTTGIYSDSIKTLRWYNAEYSSDKKMLSLDSFQYQPTRHRDSVMARAQFQTDYITLKTGSLVMDGFDLERFEKDSSLIAENITITDPLITVYRDKAPPFQSGMLKPLPVDMIRRITMPVEVGKVKVVNGWLSYTEKNAKTRAEGTLLLTNMEAELSNVKNRDTNAQDSLQLTVNAFLMDSAELRLSVKESYTDTLKGFLMNLRLRPTTVSFLNPVLVPLSNVMITSGTIDSFHMRAIGHEELAIGEMNMYYHDLRIKLVKDAVRNKTSLGSRLATFLANTFIIRKHNKGRTGTVYFERLKDRSFFNYIVKMTFSGMASSIGVKKNRKYMKQYRRALKEKGLPPIEFN